MRDKRLEIVWKGQSVGAMTSPRLDNFDLYGGWTPGGSAATDEFLRALRRGEQLEVELGLDEPKIHGTVEAEPDEEVEVKIRPATDVRP